MIFKSVSGDWEEKNHLDNIACKSVGIIELAIFSYLF